MRFVVPALPSLSFAVLEMSQAARIWQAEPEPSSLQEGGGPLTAPPQFSGWPQDLDLECVSPHLPYTPVCWERPLQSCIQD
jgi:hypothetical protein